MKLNTLFAGLFKNRKPKLLGRGIGCGKGKTSGKGHKGQKARSGVSIKGFEGGQQSIFTRLPKRGFKSKFKEYYAVVNVGDIQRLVDLDKINDDCVIDKHMLYKLGLIRSTKYKVKLLNDGELKTRLTFCIDAVSESARASVTLVGGKVEL